MSKKSSRRPAAFNRICVALLDLANDPEITDRTRLRLLHELGAQIDGLLLELEARLPEPRSRRGDPPRI